MSDKVSALSQATAVAISSSTSSSNGLSVPPTRANTASSPSRKVRSGAGNRLGTPISSIQSFRRKKYVRQRLTPLAGGDPLFADVVRPARRPLRGHSRGNGSEREDSNSQEDEDDGNDGEQERDEREERDGDSVEDNSTKEIDRLQRFHATLSSPERVQQWILTYESEKQRFASFAVFAEMKLDEIRDAVVGRPNAVEVAACFASLVKIPGIVGCYKELLEKLAAGIQSAIYLPVDDAMATALTVYDSLTSPSAPMATLVQSFFDRKTYFAHAHELKTQLAEQRSVRDSSVLHSLSVDEVVRVFVQVPLRQLQLGLAEIAVQESCSTRFDELFLFMSEKHNDRLREMHVHKSIQEDEDAAYPFFVPLASSAQICRAISRSASSFSASGKEMVLCSILEFVDVDSFKDVFKRFDAHAKALFLHHLFITETSDHLQAIVSQLPNAGEMLFRFYLVTCGAHGDPAVSAKQTFFVKLLSAEVEYFFLCDLAAYLNEEQFLLLSREYEKSVQERKRLRRARRRTSLSFAGSELADDCDDVDVDDENSDGKRGARSTKSTLESFQLMIWNFLHHHRLSSAQVYSIVTTVMLPSLEPAELSALIDYTLEQLPLDGRWLQLLRIVNEIEADQGAVAAAPVASGDDNVRENVQATRLKLLKKLFSMLSRQERESWLDKVNSKYPTEAMKRRIELLKQEASKTIVITAAPEPPPPEIDLNDPKAYVPQMSVDLKMQWMENLLSALTTDKEYSARMAMLRHVLEPFLDGKSPVANTQLPKVSVAAVEKSAVQLLNQLAPAERAKLLVKLAPPALPEVKPTLDRATSPIPELREEPPVVPAPVLPTSNPIVAQPALPTAQPGVAPLVQPTPNSVVAPPVVPASHPVVATPPVVPTSHPVAAAPPVVLTSTSVAVAPPVLPTSNSDIMSALQSLLACKPEERVLQLLRAALVAEDGVVKDVAIAPVVEADNRPRRLSVSLKRKMSAVVAVAEPMEWQECVKLGSVDVGCQTSPDLLDVLSIVPSIEAPAQTALPNKPSARVSVLPTKMAPLTLHALLGRTGAQGSPRRKENKYQKLNSAAVPRSVGSLITSWRVNTDQLTQFSKKSLSAVLKTIADAYGEMLTAGRRKNNLPYAPTRGRELTLAQVVYQQFLHSYGLPGIADTHLLAFSCAVETYRVQHLRVEYFARFCFEEVPKAELGNYLEFLECIVCDDVNVAGSGGAAAAAAARAQAQALSKRTRFVPRISVPDKENWCIGVDKAQEAAHLCFRAMRKSSVVAFCDRLAAIAALGTSSSANLESSSSSYSSSTTAAAASNQNASEFTINVDHLLQLVAYEWRDEQLRRDNYLLDAFRAGDVNGDGELTSAEFSQIVLSIDRTRDLGDILLMFSETLRRTECDHINTEVFLQVAKENELDRVVWNEDGDLRNIVNEISDLETTWRSVRCFFLGTLEALARDLLSNHFLRVCEGAGCGCLKCILDGYIGFQKMRRDFASAQQQQRLQLEQGSDSTRRSPLVISESLVWARFWHLMRQIYDAAVESDGILTPWEGSDYIRESPAPALAPRFVTKRRNALPNILFPDTNRISAVMSAVHDPEVFDAESINKQFASLLALMTYKKADGGAGGASETFAT